MKELRKTAFSERIAQAAKAREAQRDRARSKAPINDPEFADRQAGRAEANASRVIRVAKRRADKLAEAEFQKVKKCSEAAAQAQKKRADDEAHKKTLSDVADQNATIATNQKAERDARYASRKARQK